MTISVGDKIPSATLNTMTEDGPGGISTEDLFSGKKVVLFGVPGAFTPTCSAKHLPGFIDNADAITDPLLLKAIIDQCRETRCNYLLAGDGAPESWGQRASAPVADLVSRLASLPRCVLDSPDQGLMAVVLTARLARRQVRISPDLAEFAAARLRRSFRSLAVFQEMLDQEALQQLKAIDKALVLAVLESLPEHTLS